MCDVFLFLGWQDPVPEPDPEPVIKLMQSTKNGRWYVWHKELQKSAWLPARQNAVWEVMEDPSCVSRILKTMVLLLALVCFGSLSFKTVDIYIYIWRVCYQIDPDSPIFGGCHNLKNIQEPKSITLYVT